MPWRLRTSVVIVFDIKLRLDNLSCMIIALLAACDHMIKLNPNRTICLWKYFGIFPGKEAPKVPGVTPGKSRLWEFPK